MAVEAAHRKTWPIRQNELWHRLSETVTQVSVFFLSCKGITMESKDKPWPASSTIHGSFIERTFFPRHGAAHFKPYDLCNQTSASQGDISEVRPSEGPLSQIRKSAGALTPAIVSLTRFPCHCQDLCFTRRDG
jgi:hypothetical protein